jgi:hypothetical protein
MKTISETASALIFEPGPRSAWGRLSHDPVENHHRLGHVVERVSARDAESARFLPEKHTDFVLLSLQKSGVVGAVVLLALYGA